MQSWGELTLTMLAPTQCYSKLTAKSSLQSFRMLMTLWTRMPCRADQASKLLSLYVRPNVLQKLHRTTFAPDAGRSSIEVASSHAGCTSFHAQSSDSMQTLHYENCTLPFEATTSCEFLGNPVADIFDLFRSVTLQWQVGLLRAVPPLLPCVICPLGCSDDPGQHETTTDLTESRVSQSIIMRQNLS